MKYGWAGGSLGPATLQGQSEVADRWTWFSKPMPPLRLKEPTYSIIVPSMGNPDLLDCLLDSLWATARRPYDVCIGFDPSGQIPYRTTRGRSVVAATPGMSAAVNAAFSIAEGEWIIWVCDDMVFLPGWDGFEFGLWRNRALCFQLLEPFSTPHFPPSCWAGVDPASFDAYAAEREATKRRLSVFRDRRTTPGRFFGSAIFHRSKWVPWPTWCDPYSCNDISWFWEMYLTNPDLAFGRMVGNSLYHFVQASVRRAGITAPEDTGERFLRRYGPTIQDAYDAIDARSEALW